MAIKMTKAQIALNQRILLNYNEMIQNHAGYSYLNEAYLEEKLDELERITLVREEMYWLTLARLNELALLCAGNYADNFEFRAAGDLLVNPRHIDIHVSIVLKR